MWENVKNKMPNQNEYVLVHTPFCKYKCAVAFWNGVDWRSADDKTEVLNVKNWMKLPDASKL